MGQITTLGLALPTKEGFPPPGQAEAAQSRATKNEAERVHGRRARPESIHLTMSAANEP